jgi:hypothetical protein
MLQNHRSRRNIKSFQAGRNAAIAVHLKFLRRKRRILSELQMEKRHQNSQFASAHDFPKFVKGAAET